MWHPSAAGLAKLHEEGKVSAFPAIGYDPPDESHFTSRHYWEVGALDVNARSGWMGRLLDLTGDPNNPLQGLSLDYSLAPALATTKMPVAAVSSPSDYIMWAHGLGEPLTAKALQTYGQLGALPAPSPAYAQARAASLDTSIILNEMAPFVGPEGKPGYTSPVTYPTSGGQFPERLAALAAMLAGGLPIKCASLSGVGGYDTHSDEANTLGTNLAETIESVLAFQRDLEARKLEPGADRAVVGVRTPPAGKRIRHRPRRRRRGLPDRHARGRQDGRRISRSRETRRKRKSPRHVGLPRDVQRTARTVVPGRSIGRDPRSR
jgi:uncharacterized protein (DUF1501 family)